ncbi:RloB family protein [Psychromonas sp. GE-S-Ul-11]|uniref:RloB family protein n=1 Tax=Psychromonas sp. GE-S-Ul-11 TaxID=3241170 RepID=UPI00390CD33E
MGSDNLHHKRKAKKTKDLQRKKSQRASYDKILIVCEGEKTEPNYSTDLVCYYKINTANVAIDGSCGSSPRSILKRAEDLAKNESKKGDGFDRIYCVFDKDNHETYDETVDKIASKKPKGIFYAAISVPCFEYWLLLHFDYTTKPYYKSGNSSIGNEVLKDLKAFYPNYEKGNDKVFSQLIGQLEFAKQNAKRALKHSDSSFTDNPSTNIHELIDYLQNIK